MAKRLLLHCVLSITLLAITDVTIQSASADNGTCCQLAEERLRQMIVTGNGNYNMMERPVTASNYSVVVNVSLNMYALMSLEEKVQTLTAASWLKIEWQDYRARWDPEDYEDQTYLSLGVGDIWIPKIILTNQASDKIEKPVQGSVFGILLKWDGTVSLEGPFIHKTHCGMQLAKFPFDRQTCFLLFSTQNVLYGAISLHPGPDNMLDPLTATSQWRPLNLSGKASNYHAGSRVYPLLTLALDLKRLPQYYLLNIALPSCVLTFISLGVFWLTPESGERISLAVSLLLGQAVFWLVVVESLPPTGAQGTPILLVSVETNFLVGGLAILLSVATVNVQHQPGPLRCRLLRKLFLHTLPVLVCAQGGGRSRKVSCQPQSEDKRQTSTSDTVETINLGREGQVLESGIKKGFFVRVGRLEKEKEQDDNENNGKLDSTNTGSNDMKTVAAVLDRIFFLVAVVIFISGNAPLVSEMLNA